MFFVHPFSCKLAVLYFTQDGLHFFFEAVVDEAVSTGYASVACSLGNVVMHFGKSAFVYEVYDEFCFVRAFRVGEFFGVSCFNEGVVCCFYEGGDATAYDCLFSEKVGFGFVFEGCGKYCGASGTDAAGVGQRGFEGVSGCVLVCTDEGGDTFSFKVEFSYHGAYSFWSNEDYVYV